MTDFPIKNSKKYNYFRGKLLKNAKYSIYFKWKLKCNFLTKNIAKVKKNYQRIKFEL